MKYHFKVHKESDGYWAECIELQGCVTQADTKKELSLNMVEALNLYLSEPDDSKTVFPLPKRSVRAKNIEKVSVYPHVAFAFLLRKARLDRKMTQAKAAKALGMKNIWSYQKLERGQSANPALKTIAAIKKVFPNLDIEKVFEADQKSA